MLIEKIKKHLEKSRKNYPQHTNRISGIGFPCLRNCVYQITHWNEKEPPSAELLAIFAEGRHQERAMKRDMLEAGIDIVRAEEPLWLEKERLSGHPDGMIPYRKNFIVLELKSMDSNLFKKINSPDDLINSSKAWHQCYIPQIQLYMHVVKTKRGLVIIKGKSRGELNEFDIRYDKKFCQFYLNKCLDVNRYVDNIRSVLQELYQIEEIADFDKQKDREDYQSIKQEAIQAIEKHMPERINHLPICEQCNFKHICLPDEIREEQTKLYTESPAFIAKLSRRDSLVEVHLEYGALDREIKPYLKERNEPHFFVSDNDMDLMFEITVGKQIKIERVATDANQN